MLFSDAPPTNSTVVDDKFLDAVWDWLEKHPDIQIKTVDKSARQSRANEAEASRNALEASAALKHAGQRISTNEDRVWQAVAGHGVDYSRIPRRSFECLSVIAAHGPEGVIQPVVTQLTGQDKRSVPKRTDKLADNGYIVKEHVIAVGTKTTLLKLRKFVKDDAVAGPVPASERARAFPESKAPTLNYTVAHPEVWFDETLRLLKANDGIIAVQDLRLGLGIHKSPLHTRYFYERLRRLAHTGCIQRLKARVVEEDGDGDDDNYEGYNGDLVSENRVRCVQLVREPTVEDRLVFVGSRHRPKETPKGSLNDDKVDSSELGEDYELDDEEGMEDEHDDEELESLPKRTPPQWTPDLPYTNIVFNLIDNAGPEGISSMELNKRATGPLWRRPLDEIMLRLTDVWEISQPPHLRHLTIVRDTAIGGKHAHFQFRTLPNFEKAVEMGLTEWAAVQGNQKTAKKKRGRPKNNALPSSLGMDEWGFPRLDPRLFAGEDGRASLLEAQADARHESQVEGEITALSETEETPTKRMTGNRHPIGRKKRSDAGVPKSHMRLNQTPQSAAKRKRTLEDSEVEDAQNAMRLAELSPEAGTNKENLLPASENTNKEPTFDKEFVNAHPEQSFYHAGGGRYRRAGNGDRAATATTATASAKEPTYDREYVNAHPDETFYHSGRGRWKRAEQMDRRASEIATSASPSESSFKKEYVDAHPELKFYYIGWGWYKQGDKPKKRTSDGAQLEESGSVSKLPRVNKTSSPPTETEEPSSAELGISPSEKSALNVDSPPQLGVFVNPPGAKDMRFQDHNRPGPKPRAVIVVFRSNKLLGLPWFKSGKERRARRLSSKSDTEMIMALPLDDDREMEVDEQRPKKKQRRVTDSDVYGASSTPQDPSPSVSRTTRFGRPTTSVYSTRHAEGTSSSPLADSSTPAPLVPSLPDSTSRTPISTPQATTSTDVMSLQYNSINRPNDAEAEERELLSSSTLQTPDPSVVAQLPKRKRGRPSKAEIAERERVQRMSRVDQPTINPDQASVSDQAQEKPSLIVKLPLPQALRNGHTSGGTQRNPANQDKNGNQSLIVKLPFSQVKDSGQAQSAALHDVRDVRPFNDRQVAQASKQALIVKVPVPRRSLPTTADTTVPEATARRGSMPSVGTSGALSLNIIRPYLPSRTLDANEAQSNEQPDIVQVQSSDFEDPPLQYGGPELSMELNAGRPTSTSRDADIENVNSIEQSNRARISSSLPMNGHADTPDELDDAEYEPDELDGLSGLVSAELEDDFNYKERAHKKVGTTRGGGIIHVRRTRIVMDTMRKAGGVFPGDHDMWYPFVTAWQKTYHQLPDRSTVENVVNLLIKQGQLKKFKFHFRDHNEKSVLRHIITEPRFDASSPKAKKVQMAIFEAWPYRYLPKQVEISKHLRDKARVYPIVQGRKRPLNDERPEDEESAYSPVKKRSGPYDYQGNFPTVTGATVKRTSAGLGIADSEAAARSERARYAGQSKRNKAASKPETPMRIVKPDLEKISYDEDDDEESDESQAEINAEQAALQGAFRVDNYHHGQTTAVNERQGTRPRPTLQVGSEMLTTPIAPKRRSPKRKTLLALLTRPIQIFHETSGTVGTIYGIPGKPVFTPQKPLIALDTPSLPDDLNDVLEQARILGHGPASPSDSRFYQFKREADRVSAWESEIMDNGKDLNCPGGAVFINHGLNCPHIITDDDVGNAPIDFVEGTLKPFVVERGRAPQKMRARDRRAAERRELARQKDNVDAMTTTLTPAPASANKVVDPRLSTNSHSLPKLLPLLATPYTQTFQTAPRPVTFPRANKPSRPYVYKTRNKGKAPAFSWNKGVTTSLIDDEAGEEAQAGQKRALGKGQEKQKGGVPRADSKQLAIALALVRILCSGVKFNGRNKWDIVAHVLGSKYEAKALQEQWKTRTRGEVDVYGDKFVDRLHGALNEPFLEAYANGKLPRVDFDDLENTDWASLFLWVESEILPLDEEVSIQGLPATRQALEDGFEIDAPRIDKSYDKEMLSGADDQNRSQALAKSPRGTEANPTVVLDQHSILEKSWLRAITTTKEADYNERFALQKIERFEADVLENAAQEMLDTNTLVWPKGCQRPGRNYRISSYVMSQFKRWPGSVDESNFSRTVAPARNELVNYFLRQDQYELSVGVTEPKMLVLTNMVAQGLLKITTILPERNDDLDAPWPKLSRWGPIENLHGSRETQSSELHLPVVYKKTAAFTAEHGLKVDVPIPMYPAAVLREHCFRVPFWVDINGKVLDDIWDMVLQSVLHLIVYTPGCTAKGIEKAHKSKLWAWEIDLVLAWMEKVGLAVRFGAGVEEDGMWKGGWGSSEWWYCAFLPEIATRKAPVGSEDTVD